MTMRTFVSVLALKSYKGMEVQLHTFLTSALKGGKGGFHAPTALPPGKESWYPLNMRIGGNHTRCKSQKLR
jgi:hypothetical protein